MKLKQVFGDSGQKTKAAPTVSICYLNGAIRFSRSTVGGSVQLRAQGNLLYVYCASIARPILKSRKISQESARFYLSDAQQVCGQGYWKILTENVK